jgi:hypothetical protein
MNRPIDDAFTECAKAALENDFDPVPWDEAPRWRQLAAYAVADSALNTNSPDFTRSAWVLEMTVQGWYWDHAFDEKKKTHPGIVFGELTRGGVKHWSNVVAKVREVGKRLGVRMLDPGFA